MIKYKKVRKKIRQKRRVGEKADAEPAVHRGGNAVLRKKSFLRA